MLDTDLEDGLSYTNRILLDLTIVAGVSWVGSHVLGIGIGSREK